MRVFLSLLAIFTASSVLAHDHGSPELDSWYKSLRNEVGHYCCDGSDAFSVEDPDWDVTADPDKPYRVKVDGWKDWVLVNKDAVVKGPNKAGVAKVWPIFMNGTPQVRCFLPGAGA